MDVGGSSDIRVRMGKKAASVFPEAVEDVKRTLLSVLKTASAAAIWTPRRESQPWAYMNSLMNGAYLSNAALPIVSQHEVGNVRIVLGSALRELEISGLQ